MLIDSYCSMIVRFASRVTRGFLSPLLCLSLDILFAAKENLWDQGNKHHTSMFFFILFFIFLFLFLSLVFLIIFIFYHLPALVVSFLDELLMFPPDSNAHSGPADFPQSPWLWDCASDTSFQSAACPADKTCGCPATCTCTRYRMCDHPCSWLGLWKSHDCKLNQ